MVGLRYEQAPSYLRASEQSSPPLLPPSTHAQGRHHLRAPDRVPIGVLADAVQHVTPAYVSQSYTGAQAVTDATR